MVIYLFVVKNGVDCEISPILKRGMWFVHVCFDIIVVRSARLRLPH